MLDPPPILGETKVQLSLTPPDFSLHRAEDLFKALGPVRPRWNALGGPDK